MKRTSSQWKLTPSSEAGSSGAKGGSFSFPLPSRCSTWTPYFGWEEHQSEKPSTLISRSGEIAPSSQLSLKLDSHVTVKGSRTISRTRLLDTGDQIKETADGQACGKPKWCLQN